MICLPVRAPRRAVHPLLGLLFALGLALAVPARPALGQAQTPDSTAVAPDSTALARQRADSIRAARRRVRQSWTADRRRYDLGDIVTVQVEEATLATAASRQDASKSRARGGDFALSGTGAAASVPAVGLGMATQDEAESRQRGDAVRSSAFRAQMTVRVVDIDEFGRLHLQGTRVVNLDKNRQELQLSGWVRPQDISSQNIVRSSRLADATLEYRVKGSLGNPRQGLVTRLLGIFWP